MEVEITAEILEEIESRYSNLAAWLIDNFTSSVAAMFILQSVMDAVSEARAAINEN